MDSSGRPTAPEPGGDGAGRRTPLRGAEGDECCASGEPADEHRTQRIERHRGGEEPSEGHAEHGHPAQPAPAATRPRGSRREQRRQHGDAHRRREPACRDRADVEVRHDLVARVDPAYIEEERYQGRGEGDGAQHGAHRLPPVAQGDANHQVRQHRERQNSRTGDQRVEHPLGNCCQAAQQFGREGHQRVAEQPLQQEHRQQYQGRHHQAQDVGRGSHPAVGISAIRLRTVTRPHVRFV